MLHSIIRGVSRGAAIIGGIVLTFLVLLTTASITGRSLSKLANSEWGQSTLGGLSEWIIATGFDEIRGAYELTEAGVAFAIFAFLPICQFHGAHATVDIFTAGLGERANRVLRAVWEVVLTLTLLLITVQLYAGLQRYLGNGETTLFLQFPLWWSYAAAFAAAVLACVTAVYCAYARVSETLTGQPLLQDD